MTEVNAVNAQPRELDSISGTELEAIRENLADSHIKPLRMGNQSAHSPESCQNNPITKPPPSSFLPRCTPQTDTREPLV